MPSSGLWENIPKLILTKDGTIDGAVSCTWCQNVWHQTDEAGPHYYPMLRSGDTAVDVISLVPHILAQGTTHHTTNDAICGKY